MAFRLELLTSYVGMLALLIGLNSCIFNDKDIPEPDIGILNSEFPPFITPTEEYFKINIPGNHDIDGETYRLKISGEVDQPGNYDLEELRKLEMIEKTLTVECIENSNNGTLIGTAAWKGFRVYELIKNLGIKEDVSFVKYVCSDGYFTYNTLEDLKNQDILGALEMNGEPIPADYGFPLRILFPGYYGVRQPGWVVEIELLTSGTLDFWSQPQRGKWNTDTSMAVDSKIFFPKNNETLTLGDTLIIGGSAFGSKRISAVEITLDEGKTWIPVSIVKQIDEDHVWVFWELEYIPHNTGALTIYARATGVDGTVQPKDDFTYLDGTNAWPRVTVQVKDPG